MVTMKVKKKFLSGHLKDICVDFQIKVDHAFVIEWLEKKGKESFEYGTKIKFVYCDVKAIFEP